MMSEDDCEPTAADGTILVVGWFDDDVERR
jgi:hypothetical protein